jgi:hypothetical protein
MDALLLYSRMLKTGQSFDSVSRKNIKYEQMSI